MNKLVGSLNQKDNLIGKFGENKGMSGNLGRLTDYSPLANKPKIENVTLQGNKTLQDFGIREISNQEILDIANKILFTEV